MKLQRIDYDGGHLWVDKDADINISDYFYTPFELPNIGCNYNKHSHVPIEAVKIVAQTNLDLPNIPHGGSHWFIFKVTDMVIFLLRIRTKILKRQKNCTKYI